MFFCCSYVYASSMVPEQRHPLNVQGIPCSLCCFSPDPVVLSRVYALHTLQSRVLYILLVDFLCLCHLLSLFTKGGWSWRTLCHHWTCLGDQMKQVSASVWGVFLPWLLLLCIAPHSAFTKPEKRSLAQADVQGLSWVNVGLKCLMAWRKFHSGPGAPCWREVLTCYEISFLWPLFGDVEMLLWDSGWECWVRTDYAQPAQCRILLHCPLRACPQEREVGASRSLDWKLAKMTCSQQQRIPRCLVHPGEPLNSFHNPRSMRKETLVSYTLQLAFLTALSPWLLYPQTSDEMLHLPSVLFS